MALVPVWPPAQHQGMDTMKRYLIAGALAAVLVAPSVPTATGAPVAVTALKSKTFQMPSGNIACGYYGGYLRCDILSGLVPEPSKECKYGVWSAMGMGPYSKAKKLCISDTVYDPSAPVLSYGSKWKKAGIVCKSSTNGLKCKNQVGHGFFLSKANSYKW